MKLSDRWEGYWLGFIGGFNFAIFVYAVINLIFYT